MPLEAGAKLGPYEIVALIGKGGMGEVYRARDPRLERDVAIKISKEQFSERFEREARAVAALNHPNVCTLHDVGSNYLVMEFVEGEPIASQLKTGPLPLEEALRIAHQISAALEAAHEKNITHRDLKPGNIMIRPDGMVKVLDFGLAKVGRTSTSGDSGQATVTLGATQAGAVLGTPAYMAPEQAKGKTDVDKRADIWAFGVVFYELISGERMFQGGDLTEVLAAVVLKEPDLSAAPAHLRRLLKKCLEKDPKKRLRDIGDVWELVDEAPAVMPTPAMPGGAGRRWGWLAAAVAMIAAAVALWAPWRAEPPQEVVRFHVPPPEQATIGNVAVLSPDGRRVAFIARGAEGQQAVWVRSLDTLESRRLEGTEGAGGGLFWSPDSRSIGFAVGSRLRRVDALGGPPQTVADLQAGFRGGAWNRDGVIIAGTNRTGLFRISDAGGDPVPVTTLDTTRAETLHQNPVFLPDGRHFIYWRQSAAAENMGIFIGSLDATPEQQDLTRLLNSRAGAVFVSAGDSDGGYILFERERALMAQLFDASSLKLTGEAVLIANDLDTSGPPAYSASTNAVLAYRTGAGTEASTRLVWFDRQGKQVGQVGPPGVYNHVHSTDGKRVLVERGDSRTGSSHLWTADLQRAVFSRLNPGEISDVSGAMAPDGRIAFSYTPAGAVGDLYMRQANGVGEPELLFKSSIVKHVNHWSLDGRFLIYDEHHPTQRQDLWVLPMDPGQPAGTERKPIPFLVTPADETFGQFSPDGKWVAYDSDESGLREVYVQGFAPDKVPAAAVGKWTVSAAGGNKPRWSRDGKELFYLTLDKKMMAVPVRSTATSFEPGTAVPLFDANVTGFFPYAVAPDGRFLLNTVTEAATPGASPITVVLNWTEMLKK